MRQTLDQRALFEESELRRHLERALAGAQPGCEVQHAAARIIVALRPIGLAFHDPHAMPIDEPACQPGIDPTRR